MTPYQPLFTPPTGPLRAMPSAPAIGDRHLDGSYVFDPAVTLAINVALATGRPLLVRGTSGAGKTSLARALAPLLDCDYRETVVTGRTQARDLLWTVDLLRRLQDAQQDRLSVDWRRYVVPGALWHAFDPAGARAQWVHATAPTPISPEAGRAGRRVVLLIDEIDKADPDVPNSLLRPLGDLAFEVEETGQHVAATVPPPVIVITTNEERDLPPAFLRRCVELDMPPFDRERLIAVGHAHFDALDPSLVAAVADLVVESGAVGDKRNANPAEFLDVLRACRRLSITATSPQLRQLTAVILG